MTVDHVMVMVMVMVMIDGVKAMTSLMRMSDIRSYYDYDVI